MTAGTPIACQRALFDIPEDVAYFNCASLAPLMTSARQAGEEALLRRAEPWRIGIEDWFEGADERRRLFAALIGAQPDDIALVPATSYGLAIAARRAVAEPGQRIVLIADDYPSNVYTWRAFARRQNCTIHTVEQPVGGPWTEAVLAAIDERAAVVAVPNVHWTDGSLLDLVAIGDAARAAGALFVVDASQSLGALPLDVNTVRPDYLVTVGYKWLLGPFGLGYLYVAPRHHDGSPLEENWIAREGSRQFAKLTDYTDRYEAGARRFDVGERSSFELTPVAIAALRQLSSWGVANIAATLAEVTARIERHARDLGIDVAPATQRGPHMLGLRLPDTLREAAAEQLSAAGVIVGVRPGTVRIAPHLYTSDTDVDRLLDALTRLAG